MSIQKNNSPIAENIKNYIKEKGLKQSFVAKEAGLKDKEFSAMLNGRKIIMVNVIPAIAAALKTDPNTLLGFSKTKQQGEINEYTDKYSSERGWERWGKKILKK